MTPEDKKITELLNEAAALVQPLNRYWGGVLTEKAERASTVLGGGSGEEKKSFIEELRFLLEDENQLNSLFISQILKRDRYREILEALKDRLTAGGGQESQAGRQSVSDWIRECHSCAREKGFWEKERNVGEMLMLVVSELGEAIEAHRNGAFGVGKKDTFEDELADTVIRLFDLCGGLGIDLESQLAWKMRFNRGREKKHGKAY